MLSVLLTVLKIIGITLLVILAVIVVVLLLVLFVPIRYRVDADVPKTELDNGFDVKKISFSARFHWLLWAVSGGIEYPENTEFTVKVFGLRILPAKEKPKKEKPSDKAEEKSEEKTEEATFKEEGFPEDSKDSEDDKENEESSDNISEGENSGSFDDENDEEEPEEKKALIEIVLDIIDKIESFLKTPQNVFEKIQYTISRVYGKIEMIKTTLENDIFKRAFKLVKKKLIRLIKMLLPDKTDIHVLFGTGDPADTAEVMAAYGALYPVLYNKIYYEPDFERRVVGGKAHLKGHITIFTVVYCVLVCYFNKDVKKVIKRFKKIINS